MEALLKREPWSDYDAAILGTALAIALYVIGKLWRLLISHYRTNRLIPRWYRRSIEIELEHRSQKRRLRLERKARY